MKKAGNGGAGFGPGGRRRGGGMPKRNGVGPGGAGSRAIQDEPLMIELPAGLGAQLQAASEVDGITTEQAMLELVRAGTPNLISRLINEPAMWALCFINERWFDEVADGGDPEAAEIFQLAATLVAQETNSFVLAYKAHQKAMEGVGLAYALGGLDSLRVKAAGLPRAGDWLARFPVK